MFRFVSLIAASFFAFILWIIYLANTGSHSIFFELIRGMPYGDKLGHFILFGILTFLFNFACRFKHFRINRLRIYYGSFAVFAFAMLEELSQAMVATRTLDWQDIAADIFGILFFSWLSTLTNRFILTHLDSHSRN